MRLALCLGAAALLGGCNVVVTERPLFTAANEAGAPPMKPGLWRMDDEACAFDETQPLRSWPECAGGAVFKLGEVKGRESKDGQEVWTHTPFVLASGDPRIAQARVAEAEEKRAPPYGYAAVKPERFDAHGDIVAVTYWLVQCGPPPPEGAKTRSQKPALGTLHPLPGMKMKPGDAVCVTDSAEALRRAARASRAWEKSPKHAHWVRAGED